MPIYPDQQNRQAFRHPQREVGVFGPRAGNVTGCRRWWDPPSLSNASCPRSSIEHSLVGEHQRCCVALYVAAHGYRYARVQFNTVPKFDTLRALMPACPHRVRPPIDDIHTTAPSAEDRVVRLTPHLSTRTPCNYTSTQPTILLSLNFISDQCFPFLGKFHDIVYSFKLGAGERNVAVWWTMVIASADIERATADFTENSPWWEDFFKMPPLIARSHWSAQETKC